jgi:peroxiredoxin
VTISRRSLLALPAALALPASTAFAAPAVAAPAPGFTGTDSNGASVGLAQFAGKPVVLEWTNDGCPYVKKWYNSGAMQDLQRQAAAMGAVWLSIVSSPPGEQGFVEGPAANDITRTRNAAPTHVLLDPDQRIARLYGATVTPHMFIVDAKGVLAYAGGADSIPSSREADIARATPYVKEALAALAAGKPIANPVTRPYGCAVKYRTQS